MRQLCGTTDQGYDPKFAVEVEVDGDIVECNVKYWDLDNNTTPEPTDTATLRLRIE